MRQEKEYVKHWTHTLNEKGNVEIRCILEDREVFIELYPRDIRGFNQWLEVAPYLVEKLKNSTNECKHENITVDEVYGEQFCEDCGWFVDKEL
ncbi:hypothetical protein [Peribacillus tepidiphilus]|uniref:hypothetical protein n=1 Tax=Peribacillus tepidiphilus TaxID=2652445 RepID=UPI0012915D5E|nr:hypothetical protein [Peribacillus tepidiphilus]